MARPYLPFAGRRLDFYATGIGVGLFNVATAEATWPEPDFHLSPLDKAALCEEFYKLQNARLHEIFIYCACWVASIPLCHGPSCSRFLSVGTSAVPKRVF